MLTIDAKDLIESKNKTKTSVNVKTKPINFMYAKKTILSILAYVVMRVIKIEKLMNIRKFVLVSWAVTVKPIDEKATYKTRITIFLQPFH